MWRKTLLFIITLASYSSYAQKVGVFDEISKKPISNVFVYCDLASELSDKRGFINLEFLQECEVLSFQHPSYTSQVISLKILETKDSIFLEESPFNLKEAEVNYNRWEENQKEIPIKIVKIDKKEIELLNSQTSADILQNSSKAYVQKSQMGGGSPMIRGLSTNRILLVVDGVRMNTAIFREGNVQNVISIDANSLESTEIVLGPGSVVYGSDALGGVIDYHTLTPQFKNSGLSAFESNYLIRTSSANFEKTANFNFQWRAKNLSIITSISATDYDDLRMGSTDVPEYLRPTYQETINGKDSTLINSDPRNQVGSAYQQLNILQKIRYRPTSKLDISYTLNYATSSDIPRYDRLTQTDANNSLRFADWSYGPQNWMMNNLQLQSYYKTRMFDRAKVTLAYQNFEESRIDRRMNNSSRRTRTENLNATSANIDFDKSLTEKTKLFYGAEYIFNFLNSIGEREDIFDGSISPTDSRYPDNSTWTSYASYANLRTHLRDRLTLNAGLRANFIQIRGDIDSKTLNLPFDNIDQDYNAINGSIGLAYLINKSTDIKFNLSNGFRAPNIDDAAKIFESGDGIIVVPNPDLRPEYLYSADIGITKTWNSRLKFEFNAHVSLLKNILVKDDFQINGQDSILIDGQMNQIQALQNRDQAVIYGAQAALVYKVTKQLGFETSYAFNRGETNLGENLRHISPDFGLSGIRYSTEKLSLFLYAQYNSELSNERLAPSELDKPDYYAKDNNGLPYSPSWTTLNFRSTYRINQNISAQFGIDNILNKGYRTYSSGISASGINFVLALRGTIL